MSTKMNRQEMLNIISVWIAENYEFDFTVGKDMIQLYKYKTKSL